MISKKEQQHLKTIIKNQETIKWTQIANLMNMKFSCERKAGEYKMIWREIKLRKKTRKTVWSIDLDKKLFSCHQKHGPHWKKIAQQFQDFSENDVKNRFFANIRKKLRQISKKVENTTTTKKIRSIQPAVISNFLIANISDQKYKDQIERFTNFLLNFDKKNCYEDELSLAKDMIERLVEKNSHYLKQKKGGIEKKENPHSQNSIQISHIAPDETKQSFPQKMHKIQNQKKQAIEQKEIILDYPIQQDNQQIYESFVYQNQNFVELLHDFSQLESKSAKIVNCLDGNSSLNEFSIKIPPKRQDYFERSMNGIGKSLLSYNLKCNDFLGTEKSQFLSDKYMTQSKISRSTIQQLKRIKLSPSFEQNF